MNLDGRARRGGLAWVAALGALALVLWFLQRGTRASAPGAASSAQPLEALEGASASTREAPAPAPAPALPGTARAYLAEYHGERWPAIQAEMEKAKLPLDQPFVPQPWEEVELAIREKARLEVGLRRILETKDWAIPMTNEWLRKEYALPSEFELDGAELGELDLLLADNLLALQAAGRVHADRLDFHLQAAFEQGRFVRAPFSTAGLDDEQGFYARGIASGSWATTFVLTEEECPDVVEIRNEIDLLEEERDRRVRAFLAARTAR